MATVYLSMGKIHKVHEIIVLLDWFCESFVKTIDEIRKSAIKISSEFK
jgi:hypothetical protein